MGTHKSRVSLVPRRKTIMNTYSTTQKNRAQIQADSKRKCNRIEKRYRIVILLIDSSELYTDLSLECAKSKYTQSVQDKAPSLLFYIDSSGKAKVLVNDVHPYAALPLLYAELQDILRDQYNIALSPLEADLIFAEGTPDQSDINTL